jgi:hypothetical protein
MVSNSIDVKHFSISGCRLIQVFKRFTLGKAGSMETQNFAVDTLNQVILLTTNRTGTS